MECLSLQTFQKHYYIIITLIITLWIPIVHVSWLYTCMLTISHVDKLLQLTELFIYLAASWGTVVGCIQFLMVPSCVPVKGSSFRFVMGPLGCILSWIPNMPCMTARDLTTQGIYENYAMRTYESSGIFSVQSPWRACWCL